MNQREPIWWLPLLWRMLLWGAAMALVWALPGTLFVSAPLTVKLMTNDINAGVGYDSVIREIFVALIVLSSCVTSVLGFVTGLFGGFYAPPEEPLNPFRSNFFRNLGWDTFLFWLLSLFAATLCVLFMVNFVSGAFFPFALILPLILFAFCLWSALNRALRAARK